MKKFPLLIGVVTLLVLVGGIYLFSKGDGDDPSATPIPLPEGYEYYWGDGCSHCAAVQEFYDSWEDYDKANITKYEVWSNDVNDARKRKREIQCGYDKRVGVPLLFTPEGECLIGDQPIIELFENLDFSDQEQEGIES